MKVLLPLGPMLMKSGNKLLKFQFSKFQKYPTYFCQDLERKIQGKFETILAAICRSSLLKFSLPLNPMLMKNKKKKDCTKLENVFPKTSEHMVRGKQQLKFERTTCIRYREQILISWLIVKQSQLKLRQVHVYSYHVIVAIMSD